MSNLSSLLIDFKDSNDFVRLSIVLHAFTCIALYACHYHWFLCLAAIVWTIKINIAIMRQRKPYGDLCALSFSEGLWMVIFTGGEYQTYNKVHICLDAGFFTLLHFSSESHRRYMVIFHDQLSHESLKMLYVVARVKKTVLQPINGLKAYPKQI